MNVLIPAKCGNSVRTKVEMVLSPTDSAAGSPISRDRSISVRPGRRDGGLALSGLVTLETLQRLFVRRSRPPRAAVFVSQILLLSDSYSPKQESSGSEHTHLPSFYPTAWRPEVSRPLGAPGQGLRAPTPRGSRRFKISRRGLDLTRKYEDLRYHRYVGKWRKHELPG